MKITHWIPVYDKIRTLDNGEWEALRADHWAVRELKRIRLKWPRAHIAFKDMKGQKYLAIERG